MKTDRVELLSITAILTIYFGFGTSKLVLVPKDTVAIVGRLAYFNCSTSDIQSQDIHWHYYDDYVYAGGKFLNQYDQRFRIEIDNSTGSWNLVIPNVTKEDAGKYRCFDQKRFGEERWAELVVLDAEPLCTSDMKTDGIIGPNNCNVDPEDVRLSCSVTYKGNFVPMLKWTRIGGSGPINTDVPTCKNSTNRVECNLTVKSDLHLDGSSFVCHTYPTTNINCTSEPIKIIYTFSDFRITEMSINDELRCKSNSSQQCKSRWIWNAFNGSSEVFGDQPTVTANRPGIYQCQSECGIRGKQCAVSATLVYIPSGNKTSALNAEPSISEAKAGKESGGGAIIIVVAILVILLVACIIILLFCYLKRRKEKEPKQNEPELQPLNTTIQDQEEILRMKNELINEKALLEAEKQETVRLKNELQTKAIPYEMSREEVKGEKRTLEEKIERLVERKNELGCSLYLPPKEPSDYKVEYHQTIRTQAVEKDKKLGVCGVALLDNELFVITDKHPEVEVYRYNLSKFEHSRNIKLHDVVDPGDIVACHTTKRIYILDLTETECDCKLLRLDSNGDEDIERLPLKDDECRLFLTKDAKILVTFKRRRKIIEYRPTPDWNVVLKTKIQLTNLHPIHAVKLANGNLAICYEQFKKSTFGVCIVDNDGSLLKSFGGPEGAGVGQVDFPTYLAVDKNDSILVTDRNKGRVLLLNYRLEITAELLSKANEIRRPRKLLLDETKSRLFVADCDEGLYNGQVLIFNLK